MNNTYAVLEDFTVYWRSTRKYLMWVFDYEYGLLRNWLDLNVLGFRWFLVACPRCRDKYLARASRIVLTQKSMKFSWELGLGVWNFWKNLKLYHCQLGASGGPMTMETCPPPHLELNCAPVLCHFLCAHDFFFHKFRLIFIFCLCLMLPSYFSFLLFFLLSHEDSLLILERGEERERERGRDTSMWERNISQSVSFPMCPWDKTLNIDMWPDQDSTCNLLIYRRTLQPT